MAGALCLTPAASAVTYIPANNLGDATVTATDPDKNSGNRKTLVAKTSGTVRSSLGYVTFGFGPSAVPHGTPYTGGTLTWRNRPLYNSVFEYPGNVGHPTISCVTLVRGVNTIDITGDIIGYLHSEHNMPTYVVESQGGRIVISSSEGPCAPSLAYRVG